MATPEGTDPTGAPALFADSTHHTMNSPQLSILDDSPTNDALKSPLPAAPGDGADSLDTVEKLKDDLIHTSEKLSGYAEYHAELADNPEAFPDMWIESPGGARMVWGMML